MLPSYFNQHHVGIRPTIPEYDCELRWSLNDGRLGILIVASSSVLASSECRCGRLPPRRLTGVGLPLRVCV